MTDTGLIGSKIESIRLVISKGGRIVCSICKAVENDPNDDLMFKVNTEENSYLTEFPEEFSHTTFIYETISIYLLIY